MIRVVFSIVWCLALVGCDAAYNTPGIGPTIRDVVNPKGRFVPIIREPFNIDTRDTERTLSFELKYIGHYAVSIAPAHEDRGRLPIRTFGEKKSTPLLLEIELRQEGRAPLRSKAADAQFSPLGDGFVIVWFRCPEDLARGKPVTATIRVVEPDPSLQDKRGPFEVIVTELSSL